MNLEGAYLPSGGALRKALGAWSESILGFLAKKRNDQSPRSKDKEEELCVSLSFFESLCVTVVD